MDCKGYHRSILLYLLLSAGTVAVAQAEVQLGSFDTEVQLNVRRALMADPNLASQPIQINTMSGVVTLSGSVNSETQRAHVEQLVATTVGVLRVIDQLTVSVEAVPSGNSVSTSNSNSTGGGILQSDGTYTTMPDAGVSSSRQEAQLPQSGGDGRLSASDEVPPANGPDTDAYGRPLKSPRVNDVDGFPAVQPGNGPSRGYDAPYGQGQEGNREPHRYGIGSGQLGGQVVTLPAGTILRIRINQHLSSREVGLGTLFDGLVINDIAGSGQIVIPRGTFLQGNVIDVETAGHLKGRGELGLKLTQIMLGGKTYAVNSDTLTARGGDKTIQTVNNTVGLGALGAIFGAVAGGGVGAAIGAGAGGALGLGASAASGRGDVFIPSEAVLAFRLNQPVDITTVAQAEMQRLASGVPAGEGRPQVVRRYPYPYYRPGFYPGYYRPYRYAY